MWPFMFSVFLILGLHGWVLVASGEELARPNEGDSCYYVPSRQAGVIH